MTDNVSMREKTYKKKPLLSRYLEALGLHDAAVARLCGLSRTNIARARYRSLNAENSEQLSRCLAGELGLSEEERLSLKAEIMGFPGSLTRAYFGGIEAVHKEFRVGRRVVIEILTSDREISGNAAPEIERRLKKGDVPRVVADDIRSRIGAPKGTVTYRGFGKEIVEKRVRKQKSLRQSKPKTDEAIRESGLSRRDLYRRAGIGRETLRKALYDRCGKKAASAIADVLEEVLSLSEQRKEDVRRELTSPPKTSF